MEPSSEDVACAMGRTLALCGAASGQHTTSAGETMIPTDVYVVNP